MICLLFVCLSLCVWGVCGVELLYGLYSKIGRQGYLFDHLAWLVRFDCEVKWSEVKWSEFVVVVLHVYCCLESHVIWVSFVCVCVGVHVMVVNLYIWMYEQYVWCVCVCVFCSLMSTPLHPIHPYVHPHTYMFTPADHCVVGTEGHAVVDNIHASLLDWSEAHGKPITFMYKGGSALTEMFSAVKAEVEIFTDPRTTLNQEMLLLFRTARKVTVICCDLCWYVVWLYECNYVRSIEASIYYHCQNSNISFCGRMIKFVFFACWVVCDCM